VDARCSRSAWNPLGTMKHKTDATKPQGARIFKPIAYPKPDGVQSSTG
jgi:chitodextrinase